jgi:WD40 repeat protein
LCNISSRDSKLFLLSQEDAGNKLWAYSMPSRELTLLRSGVSEAALSPDGLKLATSIGRNLSISTLSGTLKSKVDLPGIPTSMQWSPDSQTIRLSLIAFAGAATSSEWQFNEKDGRVRPSEISASQEFIGNGVWSQNGDYFIYEAGKARLGIYGLLVSPKPFLSSRHRSPNASPPLSQGHGNRLRFRRMISPQYSP